MRRRSTWLAASACVESTTCASSTWSAASVGVGETATGCGESTKAGQLQELQDRLSHRFRPWSRSAQFWVRAADIYSSYKVCQLRAGFIKEEREALWEQQHELGDLFLKVQHPGAEHLMMVDIQNMQAFALFLQKYGINFDLFSATKEMEKQVFIQSNSTDNIH